MAITTVPPFFKPNSFAAIIIDIDSKPALLSVKLNLRFSP